VYVYPSVICLSGVNNSQIVQSPLSVEDNLSFKGQNPTGHFSQLNTHDLVGWGLMGQMHKLMNSGHMVHRLRKHRMHRGHLREAIQQAMPAIAEAMHGSHSAHSGAMGAGVT